jgi:GTP cyclohydrolase II
MMLPVALSAFCTYVFVMSEAFDTTAARIAGHEGMAARRMARAVSELQRGQPIVLQTENPAEGRWLLLALDAASEADWAEWQGLLGHGQCPALLLSGERAHLLATGSLPDPAMTGLQPSLLPLAAEAGSQTTARLFETLRQIAGVEAAARSAELRIGMTAPTGLEAAITLLKRGYLMPAALVWPLTAEAGYTMAEAGVMRISPREVEAAVEQAPQLRRVIDAAVPLALAEDSRISIYRITGDSRDHLAIEISGQQPRDPATPPLVRVHAQCFTGDLLGSLRCDCGEQLRSAISLMAKGDGGILLYLAQEGREIGLANKLRSYRLQDAGMDTVDANLALGFAADERDHALAAAMLSDLGVKRIRLLTNNPDKVARLEASGISVAERIPHRFAPNPHNAAYLDTKRLRSGHHL